MRLWVQPTMPGSWLACKEPWINWSLCRPSVQDNISSECGPSAYFAKFIQKLENWSLIDRLGWSVVDLHTLLSKTSLVSQLGSWYLFCWDWGAIPRVTHISWKCSNILVSKCHNVLTVEKRRTLLMSPLVCRPNDKSSQKEETSVWFGWALHTVKVQTKNVVTEDGAVFQGLKRNYRYEIQ